MVYARGPAVSLRIELGTKSLAENWWLDKRALGLSSYSGQQQLLYLVLGSPWPYAQDNHLRSL